MTQTGDIVLFKNRRLLGEKKLKPRPENRMLVSLRGYLQNFRRAHPSFLYGSSPPPLPNRAAIIPCSNENKSYLRFVKIGIEKNRA